MSWEAHERDHQFGGNDSINIGQSPSLRNESNASIIMMSAMRPCLAKIIQKVRISRYFESPETDHHRAEIACCTDYAATWLLKRVDWLPQSQIRHCGTTYHGYDDMSELDTAVDSASLPIIRIHLQVALISTIRWLLASLYNTGWMAHCQLHPGRFEDILLLHPVDVEVAYGRIASHFHSLQYHIRSYGCLYATYSSEDDSIKGRLVLCWEVSVTADVAVLCWSEYNDSYASDFCTYPRSFPEVAIV